MTDKREKFYLVNERSLRGLQKTAKRYMVDDSEEAYDSYAAAQADCRKIEVPTHAIGFYIIDDEGNPKCLSFGIDAEANKMIDFVLDRYLNGKKMAQGYQCRAVSLEEARTKAVRAFYEYRHKPDDFVAREK